MKLLAVDDDPVVLDVLRACVASHGQHELVTTQDPQEAIRLATQSDEFDCLFTDIVMPGMTGIEVVSAVRTLRMDDELPILMITSMQDKQFVDEAFAAGATDYLTKPLEFREFSARLGLIERAVGRTKQAGPGAVMDQSGAKVPSLHTPIHIQDVDRVIPAAAFENYIRQLTRSALFGSAVFAFTLQRAETLFSGMSTYDFNGLVTDIAEALSDCMEQQQALTTYIGNGTFLCVSEGGWTPEPGQFVEHVQTRIQGMDLYTSDAQPIRARLSGGDVIRLSWRHGINVLDALLEAENSARSKATQDVAPLVSPQKWLESCMVPAS